MFYFNLNRKPPDRARVPAFEGCGLQLRLPLGKYRADCKLEVAKRAVEYQHQSASTKL